MAMQERKPEVFVNGQGEKVRHFAVGHNGFAVAQAITMLGQLIEESLTRPCEAFISRPDDDTSDYQCIYISHEKLMGLRRMFQQDSGARKSFFTTMSGILNPAEITIIEINPLAHPLDEEEGIAIKNPSRNEALRVIKAARKDPKKELIFFWGDPADPDVTTTTNPHRRVSSLVEESQQADGMIVRRSNTQDSNSA